MKKDKKKNWQVTVLQPGAKVILERVNRMNSWKSVGCKMHAADNTHYDMSEVQRNSGVCEHNYDV